MDKKPHNRITNILRNNNTQYIWAKAQFRQSNEANGGNFRNRALKTETIHTA